MGKKWKQCLTAGMAMILAGCIECTAVFSVYAEPIAGEEQQEEEQQTEENQEQEEEEAAQEKTEQPESVLPEKSENSDSKGETSDSETETDAELSECEVLAEDSLTERIKTKEDWNVFASSVQEGNDYSGKTVYLENDINLQNDEQNQTLMAGKYVSYSDIKSFAGTFEGQGHTITGIYIKDEANGYKGLFGKMTGTVRNLTVKGAITGKLMVGGIAYQCGGTIENCTSYVSVNSNGNQTAGITGNLLATGKIVNCANYGNVASTAASNGSTAGIAGNLAAGAQITGCFNVGKVEAAATNAGGIAASSGSTKTQIRNCYNAGTVSVKNSNKSVGGILGNGTCTMENCYNIGMITGPAGAGALIGFQNASAKPVMNNCYYLEESASFGIASVEDETGKMSGKDMRESSFSSKLNADAYKQDNNNVNQGYPILSWQTGEGTPVERYTVTFMKGTEVYKVVEIVKGEKAAAPDNPEKEGFSFAHWSADNTENGAAYDFHAPVNSNLTLYAVWKEGKPVYADWDYEIIEKETAVKITKYKGNGTVVMIPAELAKLPVREIGNAAFAGNSKISSVVIPESVTKVEDGTGPSVGAFAGCTALRSVVFSPNMKKAADYMFYGAAAAHEYALSVEFKNIDEIGDYAFSCCNNIVTLRLSEKVKKIGYGAFYQARRLKTLEIPAVSEIQADAFTETIFEEEYENLWKEGKFSGIVYAGNVAYLYMSDNPETKEMEKDKELVLKEDTLGISEFLFSNHYIKESSCKTNLKKITIPEKTIFIAKNLFNGFGAVSEDNFSGIDMCGIKNSYAEKYAAEYANIRFNPLNEKDSYDDSLLDYDWYDKPDKKNHYVIHNVYELRAFEDIMDIGEDDFSGAEITLASDIDLGGMTEVGYGLPGFAWTRLDGFAGTFNGNGHTISGVYMNVKGDNVGFFGSVAGTAVVKDLNVEGTIKGKNKAGGIVGSSSKGAKIEGCTFNGLVSTEGDVGYTGGIIGYAMQTNIENCAAKGKVNGSLNYVNSASQQGYTGGIVGYNYGSTVKNCTNEAEISGNAYGIGGVAGQSLLAEITDSQNKGSITGKENVGGITGKSMKTVVLNCKNSGEVQAESKTGGIVGFAVGIDDNGRSVVNCSNAGSIHAQNHIGGIVGYVHDSSVQHSYNEGTCSAEYSFAGGIAGYALGAEVQDCYNLGQIITDDLYAGGIVAYDGDGECKIRNCYNAGEIQAENKEYQNPISNVYGADKDAENCFYLAESDDDAENSAAGSRKTFESGKIAVKLGEAYGQLIGKDAYPVFRTADNEVKTLCAGFYNGELTEEIKEKCHDFGEWSSLNCEEEERKCQNEGCKESETRQKEVPVHNQEKTGEKAASCTEEGYTGDIVCKDCGKLLEKGSVIAKTEHQYENGVCKDCGKKQPEVKPEVKPEPKPEPKPEVKPETKPEPKPEVKPETKPEQKPETKPETNSGKNADSVRTGDTANTVVWLGVLFACLVITQTLAKDIKKRR